MNENDNWKTEYRHILKVDKDSFAKSMEQGDMEGYIEWVSVNPSNMIYIQVGIVYVILGVLKIV